MIGLFIVYFIFFIDIYSKQIVILNHQINEEKLFNEIYRFSLIELDVIKQVVLSFDDYKCENFSLSYAEGEVLVRFIDEEALIIYQFEHVIYAVLSYDLVFDTALDYEIISEELYMTIDKFED